MSDPLDYDRLMEDALQGVMRRALTITAERGLPGQHHFYITFRTDLPEVGIPPHLRQRFPREMTIVVQHQFWGLEAGERGFAVTLSFDQKHERLNVPYRAVTAFVDPSVQFGLQFPTATNLPGATEAPPAPATIAPPAEGRPAPAPQAATPPAGDGARVVALDAFRKKQ